MEEADEGGEEKRGCFYSIWRSSDTFDALSRDSLGQSVEK